MSWIHLAPQPAAARPGPSGSHSAAPLRPLHLDPGEPPKRLQSAEGSHGTPQGAAHDQTTFRDLCEAFRATGGIARADDLARLLEDFQCGNFASLAKHIARHEILSFSWRGMHWVPMFQFDLRDLSLRSGPRQLLQACGTRCDGWALACWLTTPTEGRDGPTPLDRLDTHLDAVCEAARRQWQPGLAGPDPVRAPATFSSTLTQESP